MLNALKLSQPTFVIALHIIYFPPVLAKFDMDSPLLSPPHQFVVKVAQKDKDAEEFSKIC